MAMQDLFWPAKYQELDRPADLLCFESSLSPTMMVGSFEATIAVATLILALRKVALDQRRIMPVVPNPDAPLTKDEVGVVLDFWKGKFNKQPLTQEQNNRDLLLEGLTNNQRRKRKRGRWYTYMGRSLGNRKLGMALITTGVNVDLNTLATAYNQATAQAKADGDASSLPSRELRQRVLATRAWYRWGRQLDNKVESNAVTWESLGSNAKKALEWYKNGWSGAEVDKLTNQSGNGMLRTGPSRGEYLDQQATGSVVDRMRPNL